MFKLKSSSSVDVLVLFLKGTRVPETPGVKIVGFIFLLPVNCPATLLIFLRLPLKLELLSSSGNWLFSMSSSIFISFFSLD